MKFPVPSVSDLLASHLSGMNDLYLNCRTRFVTGLRHVEPNIFSLYRNRLGETQQQEIQLFLKYLFSLITARH